jgi:hypothetical protein
MASSCEEDEMGSHFAMSFVCPDSYMDDDGVRGKATEYPAAFPNPSNEAQKIGVHLDSTPDEVAPASPARLRGNIITHQTKGETVYLQLVISNVLHMFTWCIFCVVAVRTSLALSSALHTFKVQTVCVESGLLLSV